MRPAVYAPLTVRVHSGKADHPRLLAPATVCAGAIEVVRDQGIQIVESSSP